jgi:hypothetical protein
VAALRSGIWPLSYVTVDAWTLFFSLVLISMACIIMGADAAPVLLSFRVWLSPGFPMMKPNFFYEKITHDPQGDACATLV